jgi:hypothetical protein
MGARTGTNIRLEIDTSLTATPSYKKINHEQKMDENWQTDTEEVKSKDTGQWKDYIKTFSSATLSITAIDDNVNGGFLDFEAVQKMSLANENSANRGRYKMKITSTVPGSEGVEFIGIISSCKRGNDAGSLATFDFEVMIVGLPTFTPVV